MEQTAPPTNGPVLRRPISGRSVAGVAAAISEYFNIPVGLVRAGLVISVFFGGIGLAAYAAGWVLIREEGEEESLVERWLANASSPSSWLGLGLVALAVVILLGSIDAFSGSTMLAAVLVVGGILLYRGVFDDGVPSMGGRMAATATASGPAGSGTEAPPSDGDVSDSDMADALAELPPPVLEDSDTPPPPPPVMHTSVIPKREKRPRSRLGRFIWAALLITVGSMAVVDSADVVSFGAVDYFAAALLVVGAGLLVGAIFGRAYGLIAVGLVLVVAVQAATWFDVPLEGGFGDPVYSPVTATELRDEYRLFAGEMTLDLSDLDAAGDISTEISLGAGELTVEVPNDANVIVDLRVVAGELVTPDTVDSGTDIDRQFVRRPAGAEQTITIDASVGFGQLNLVVEGR